MYLLLLILYEKPNLTRKRVKLKATEWPSNGAIAQHCSFEFAQYEFVGTEGRWLSEVQDVLKSCNINYTEDQISKMSQAKFKKIIKEHIQSKVLVYLVTLQNKHTKSENLHLDGKMQPYLKTEVLSLSEKKLLFSLRTKMLRLKANFSSMFGNDLTCSLCEEMNSIESETHLLNCSFLKKDKVLENEMQ
jgi:hypothetical protein